MQRQMLDGRTGRTGRREFQRPNVRAAQGVLCRLEARDWDTSGGPPPIGTACMGASCSRARQGGSICPCSIDHRCRSRHRASGRLHPGQQRPPACSRCCQGLAEPLQPCWARSGSAASSSWPWTAPRPPPTSPRPVSPPRGNRSRRAAAGRSTSRVTGWLCSAAHAAPFPQPLAVYVLDELVQALGAGDSRAGVDAVCARLAHRSPVVKQKVGGRECLLTIDCQTGVGPPGWSGGVGAAGRLARQLTRSLPRLLSRCGQPACGAFPSQLITCLGVQQSSLPAFVSFTSK